MKIPGREPSSSPEGLVGSEELEGGPALEQLLAEVEGHPEAKPLLGTEGLEGKCAIVTGGSTGIGRGVALALADAGVHIAFNYIEDHPDSVDQARTTARELEERGVKVFHRPIDWARAPEVGEFVGEALDELKGLHILVNNAGVTQQQSLHDTSDEMWREVIGTNLSSAFFFLRAVAPIFQAQEYGKVVNVASVYGIKAGLGLAGLSASKAGVLALTRSAALEFGPRNVNVNAVAPGYIRTSWLTRHVPAETLDRVREQSALRRLGDPQDVAGAVLFLCSEAARHITGAVLPVDGGYLL